MFPLSVAVAVLCGPLAEMVRIHRSLELDLRVIEAFENGPVIFDASITNRGPQTLVIEELTRGGLSLVCPPENWALEDRRPVFCRLRSGPGSPLRVGQTYTERHTLHRNYRSRFPAGTHSVEVVWEVAASREFRRDGEWSVLLPEGPSAFPTKTFAVTISPATPANGYALAARWEAEYAALPADSRADAEFGGPFDKFCAKVTFAPHKELIPLLLRVMDRVPVQPEWAGGRVRKLELAETVFDADPAAAHRIFIDRLLSDPQPVDIDVAFSIWKEPHRELGRIADQLFIMTDRRFWERPELWARWDPLGQFGELVRWANESAPRMLPDAELRRLAGSRDPRVRELLRTTFGNRLDP